MIEKAYRKTFIPRYCKIKNFIFIILISKSTKISSRLQTALRIYRTYYVILELNFELFYASLCKNVKNIIKMV